MKRLIALLIVLVFLLLALWFFWPSDQASFKQSQPNIISKSGDVTTAAESNPDPIKPKMTAERILQAVSATDPYLVKPTEELSYLDVYRMNRLYLQCQDVIYGLLENENFDATVQFENQSAHFIKNHPTWPTNSQYQAVERHAIKCDALLKQVQALDLPELEENKGQSRYLVLRQQLNDYLNTIKPNSSQEKKIADALNLIQVWQQNFEAVMASSKGDETQNATEIANINAQIIQLHVQQSELSPQMQEIENNPEAAKQWGEIWQEIQRLKLKLTELKPVDTDARNTALEVFEITNNEIFQQLRTDDPDVFFEVQIALERNRTAGEHSFGHAAYKDIGKGRFKMPFIEYVSPGDVLQSMVGMGDSELFGLVINYATLMYLCELGADCGPNSQWLNFYCIKPTPFMNPASCDSDLITFYQDHLLNQNQWDDVQTVLQQIRGIYAE